MAFEDRFKLRLPLGEGDLGAVWDAEDQEAGASVAVALLDEDAPEAVRARFVEAGKVLAGLDHPSLVRVRASGEDGEGAAFLSMELLRGQSLLERLSEGPPIKIEEFVGMTIDLVEGLEKVHAAGIVHGDIEPGNLILVEEGGKLRAKLIGFGLNRAEMRGGSVDESHDGTESALRSFASMSPEQARKEVVADVKSDIYSLGVVLYDALTGKLPYRGTSLAEVRQSVAKGGAKPVHEVRSELAGALAGAIDRAMSHKPVRRFADAAAMRKALRAALIMSPKVKGLDVAIAPRKLERDSSLMPVAPEPEGAPTDETAKAPEAQPRVQAAKAPEGEGAPTEKTAKAPPAPDAAQAPTVPKKIAAAGLAPPPPAAMPKPAAKPGSAKTEASPPKEAAFGDESTEELSLESIEVTESAPPPPKASAPPPPAPKGEAAAVPPPVPEPSEAAPPPAPEPAIPPADPFAAPAAFDAEPALPLPSSGPPKRLLLGGGLAAAVLLVLVIAVASGGDDDASAVEAASPPQTAEAAPEPAPAEEPEPEPPPAAAEEPAPEPSEPETVAVVLRGVPEGATVTVDGEPHDGSELALARDHRVHEIRVQAEGFEPWTRGVVGDSDAEIAVEMDAIEEPEPAPAPAPERVAERPARRVHSTPTPRRTRPTPMRARVVRDPGF